MRDLDLIPDLEVKDKSGLEVDLAVQGLPPSSQFVVDQSNLERIDRLYPSITVAENSKGVFLKHIRSGVFGTNKIAATQALDTILEHRCMSKSLPEPLSSV